MTPMERIEHELQEARQRIEELDRHNVGLANESCAQQEQIAGLKSALTRQAKAAKQGMDAAKAAAYTMEQNASRMYAECSPEALESERAANAMLTDRIAELEEREAALAAQVELLIAAGDLLREPWDLNNILGPETRRRVEGWDNARARVDAPTTTSLSLRDAEILEYMASEIKSMHPKASKDGIAAHLLCVAASYRQKAEVEQ